MHRKYLLLIGFIIILFLICGCSSQYHYKRILKKDPTFFKVDTTIIKLDAPTVTTSFDCNKLIRDGLPTFVTIPRTYTDERGRTKTDSVRVKFMAVDSAMIRAEIDCPEPEVRMVPEPYQVYVQPTLKEKLKAGASGAAILILLLALIWLARKIIVK